jgi:hypothetical protein
VQSRGVVNVMVVVKGQSMHDASSSSTANNKTTSSAVENILSLPGQLGSAILRITDGTILHGPAGLLTPRDMDIIYRIMLEVGTILVGNDGDDDSDKVGRGADKVDEGLFRKLTLQFQNVIYIVVIDGECMYVVKKKSS